MVTPRCFMALVPLCLAWPAGAQRNVSIDTARIARACAGLRYPVAGLSESQREKRAIDAYAESLAGGHPRAGVECLLARTDVRALGGDIAFMVDSVSRFLRVLDSLGERRFAIDMRLMRGGALIAPGALQVAREDLTRSMADARALGDSVLEFWSAGNLAQALYASGDPVAAYRPAQRAIALGSRLTDAARAFSTALEGDVLAGQGQWSKAATLYGRAARLSTLAGHAGGAAHALELQGTMSMRQGQWSVADSLIRHAVQLYARDGYAGNAGQLNYLLASVSLQRRRLSEARERLREASKHAIDDGNLLYFIRLREAEIRWREGDLDVAVRLLHRAAGAMDGYRATLTNRGARLSAFQASPDDTDPDAGIASMVAALVAVGRPRDALEIVERGRARELLARLPQSISAADSTRGITRLVQRALPADVAIIEYVAGSGGEPTSAFVLTTDTILGFVTTPVDSMSEPIAQLRAVLEGSGDPRALASRLGAALLGEVVEALPERVKYLVFVPDGALHRVPFDVLRMSDGRFVFERFATSIAPSAAVMRTLFAARRQPASGIVAIGGAAYGAPVNPEEAALPQLPYAAREAAIVARLGVPSMLLRGQQATVAAFADAVRQPRQLLHIATHARADEFGTGEGALVLSADSANDGVLSTTQLLEMRIDADLVVLSACQSGVGPLLRGEGMQALTAPFLAGGTRSLVATMWQIGDRQTVPLISSFYSELAAGHPVAEALRRARWRAWKEGASPREWAAFVAVGNPIIRVPLKAPASVQRLWWPWLAVVLSAAVALWIIHRRLRAHAVWRAR